MLTELDMTGVCTGLILNDVLNYVLLRSMIEPHLRRSSTPNEDHPYQTHGFD